MIIHLNYDNDETYYCIYEGQAKLLIKKKFNEGLTLVGFKIKSDHEKDGIADKYDFCFICNSIRGIRFVESINKKKYSISNVLYNIPKDFIYEWYDEKINSFWG